MWTRKELKDKAKVSFKANYWKSVLVALILVVLAGGMGGFYSANGASNASSAVVSSPSTQTPDDVNVQIKDGKVVVDVDDADGKVHVNLDADDLDDLEEALEDAGVVTSGNLSGLAGPGAVVFGLSFGMLLLVVMAISLVIFAFILNPLGVGAQRFFLRDLNQRAEVKEVTYAYDNNYQEVVKTAFLRDLFIFLWSLLLIVPGIYKSYEYRMIPYLLAEDPTMTKDRAFAESKRMMDGQKWNAFVLDLSFLGWNILSALTLGILGVFYVAPYQAHTNAALYEKLRYGLPAPDAYAQPAPAPAAPVPPASYGANAWAAPAASAAPVAVAAPAANGEAVQTTGTPVIASASQPPVPPFAAEGYEPDDGDADETPAEVTDDAENGTASNSDEA